MNKRLKISWIIIGVLALIALGIFTYVHINASNKPQVKQIASKKHTVNKHKASKKAKKNNKISSKKSSSKASAKVSSSSISVAITSSNISSSQPSTVQSSPVRISQSGQNIQASSSLTQAQQGQINRQTGHDSKGNAVMPGQNHAPGDKPDGTSDDWVKGQEQWAQQHGTSNTVTSEEASRAASVDKEPDSDFQ